MNQASTEKLTLDHSVQLYTLAGQQLTAAIRELVWIVDEASTQCKLRLETDWPTFITIVDGEWFGLHPAVSGGLAVDAFEANQSVELIVELRKGIRDALFNENTTAEDILHTILTMPTDNDAAQLNQSESWMATEVKQQTKLPPELAAEGSLKQGFRTLWAESTALGAAHLDALPADESNRNASMQQMVNDLLSGWGWSFQRNDPHLLTLGYQGESGHWSLLVVTDEVKRLCLAYSVFPAMIPETHRATVLEWLSRVNYDLPIGSFDLDLSDGELRLRSGMDVERDRLSTQLLSNLLTTNLAVMDLYYPEIAALIEQA